jgi:hypothetical protein
MLLAARLGSKDLRSWVDRELNGYREGDALPEYRVLNVGSFGDFLGAGGSQLKNSPIPPMTIPDEFREMVTVHRVKQPISALVELLSGEGTENFQVSWPADLTMIVGSKIVKNMTCFLAWKSVSRGSVAAVVDTVRTRILKFVIEVEASAPDAGEAQVNSQPLPQGHLTQIFNTNIWGAVGNLAAGSHDVVQGSQMEVHVGDLESLRGYLSRVGVAPEDVAALETSVRDDSRSDRKLGPNVTGWLARMIQKAAQGTLKIGTEVAATVLTKAISKYLGIE